MLKTANLGFPRIGANRELKKAVENYWKKTLSVSDLQKEAATIRAKNWQTQKSAEIAFIPSNDFSFYDQTLDTIALFGAIPDRFKFSGGNVDLDLYFAMARGNAETTAMEMTKWFDTNYHYIVAEFKKNQQFKISSSKIFDEFLEAKKLGIETRPVILGPISFLLLGKSVDGSNKLDLLDNLLLAYRELFKKLREIGVKNVQIDEPFLATDLSSENLQSYLKAYPQIKQAAGEIDLHLTTYFETLSENTSLAFDLETASVHVDLVRASQQFEEVLKNVKPNQILSLGLVDGRNIWINNFENSISLAKKAVEKLGKDRVIIAPSCSLLHSPVDLENETMLDSELKSWLAFATQKLTEIAVIAKAVNGQENDVKTALEANKNAIAVRKTSKRIHDENVKKRVAAIDESITKRQSNFAERKKVQTSHINLPLLPTTSIGSFPQTKEVRKYRADFKAGTISAAEYEKFIREETTRTIRFQEEIGLDVLVHGEFERNDMVEYFGEQLKGFFFTKNGWVQSYGSRCVKPPVIFGDVSRPRAMTVEWAKYAQSQTTKIMKGMLTGPITILQWSFVRDDQPRKDTALQIAFAIRDEVVDLETAGIKIIQIDEAALREGLPIRKNKWQEYLKWAVEAFRITSSGVANRTQIHTHMCYSEFNDIIEAIAQMDADVISIETSRSQMELLNAFVNFKYPNEIGPGVYDIHSPRVPKQQEMENLLKKALDVLKPEQIWVNPDCGLKTRDWPETKAALQGMVDATRVVRAQIQ
ncbi:MAG: 5-methyltetrahydropteroyltriglutamate--homocysteine S-methyltransferase [Alphaproteobacteria bacterium RIFCSPLOWO2_01_FULL_40_26]|nr:MAG: 5-methyltetrahydropteroyltriglutamate--homocysteine S-methyltransferase [Alphaproteobacteria bacterium RIFCSPHIGHO2_02_FULL_40_34]OFW94700.1 MAG: 5-methyltetrahydropteroyltriglutamate--homocysteine S-methyltransferase [Alphaproteobacteria bacterium RIFCSPLOWO2_01_FULL_40_26]OFX10168.1 MAG: 5-methyltetrahydropteroyltriglutamate--homocysteine S-methyltransferase [Alphaproteobacteria bacterium RIFCSPLOWO2_02_FULL_40_19]OFX11797.1 MAG: 5-methyltetrahydropteroyltriglutamate--homocysteine S-me